jgi:glycosyltransferase involved in cell wall biosynthesis
VIAAQKKLPISVCMIAGNEAHRIRRALESVAGWADEIIVLLNDDVSDGTDRIAKSFGAKVFREPWKGYVAQKNSAAQKAGPEWILSLDADEVVSPELRAEIQKLFDAPGKNQLFVAFSFPRCTFYGGRWIRHGDWYPDRKVRLWRRGRARWTGAEVHEILQADGAVGKLWGDLLHYSMEDLDHMVRKTLAYSDDFLRQRLDSGRKVSSLDVWVRPVWRFGRAYFLRMGFLDGWQGFHVAWMGAFYTFLRYARVLEEQHKIPTTK